MKTSEFEKILELMGYQFIRSSKHRIWSNGTKHIAVPQGRTINRMVCRRILKEIGYQGTVQEINFG